MRGPWPGAGKARPGQRVGLAAAGFVAAVLLTGCGGGNGGGNGGDGASDGAPASPSTTAHPGAADPTDVAHMKKILDDAESAAAAADSDAAADEGR